MGDIKLNLTEDEALIIFDWITRFNEKENNEFEDQAEERALWNLEALLEKKITIIFSDNYQQLVNEARNRIRD